MNNIPNLPTWLPAAAVVCICAVLGLLAMFS